MIVGYLTRLFPKIPIRRLIFPSGPTFARNNFETSTFDLLLGDMVKVAKRLKAVSIEFFPSIDAVRTDLLIVLSQRGFNKVEGLFPCETLIIDLNKTVESLWASLKKSTRNETKKADRAGFRLLKMWDIDRGCEMWPTAPRKCRRYLETIKEQVHGTEMLLAKRDSTYVSFGLFVGYSDTIKYLHGGINRLTPGSSGEWLLWQAILIYRMRYKWLDLGGAMVTRPSYKRPGEIAKLRRITQFKTGFGGVLRKELGYFRMSNSSVIQPLLEWARERILQQGRLGPILNWILA